MEISEWAELILAADTLEGKLCSPSLLTDEEPGTPQVWKEPVRPPGMAFCRRSRQEKIPPFHAHHKPDNRAICLHRFAGHELLAVEIMAFALLAFPEAPASFRKGVVHTLKEEQGHVALYITGMKKLGVNFGDLPLYRHFWMHTPYITSPLHYISLMSLTFEMANLDFAPMYKKSFLHVEDEYSASIMDKILEDEIHHVSFGWRWLNRLKKEESEAWEAWVLTLSSTLIQPKRAKGFLLHEQPRLQAGIPKDWIQQLRHL